MASRLGLVQSPGRTYLFACLDGDGPEEWKAAIEGVKARCEATERQASGGAAIAAAGGLDVAAAAAAAGKRRSIVGGR